MKALEAPTYVQPAADPALQILEAQSDRQDMAATQATVSAANARHALMYGTRMAIGGQNFMTNATAPLMTPLSLAR